MDPERGAPLLSSTAPSFDHAARLARLRERLERAGADGVALAPGPNLRWATGLVLDPSERPLLLLVRARGEDLFLVPALERDRLAPRVAPGTEVVPWADREDPLAIAARHLGSGRWLLDPQAPFWLGDARAERGTRLRSARALLADLRRRKEPAEVAAIARAQELTRQRLAEVPRILAAGVTEREIAEALVRGFEAAGAAGWALVQFAEGTAVPHGESGERRLPENAAVLVDLGAVVAGYHADLTRSWWFGERPHYRYGEIASAVERAQARAAALVRPGVRAADLDGEARRHLEAEGLAHLFVHRLGHGVGLEIHEPPYLVEGGDALLQPGDVFTIEPAAYLPGAFGVRHEDVWVVEEGGGRRL